MLSAFQRILYSIIVRDFYSTVLCGTAASLRTFPILYSLFFIIICILQLSYIPTISEPFLFHYKTQF